MSALCFSYLDGVCTEDVPWYYSSEPSLLAGVPDHHLALAAPIAAYWLLSTFFHYLDTRDWKGLEYYHIHSSPDAIASSNTRVSPTAVFWTVIFQQITQTVLGYMLLGQTHIRVPDHASKRTSIARQLGVILSSDNASRLAYFLYWWGIPLLQLLAAMVTLDTWQYFLHRWMHTNRFIFRHFHSWHHRLDAPYAFGALYNHPVESFLLDVLGPVIAESLSGMSTRQSALFFAIATLKTVDDHCGYRLPFDPLQMVSRSNAYYHDIHHQKIGFKYNFAQPFFVHWDILLGTQMTREEMERRKQNSRAKVE